MVLEVIGFCLLIAGIPGIFDRVPDHTDQIQTCDLLLREGIRCSPLPCKAEMDNPVAEFDAGRRNVSAGNAEITMLPEVFGGFEIILFPLFGDEIIPDHADGIKLCDTFRGYFTGFMICTAGAHGHHPEAERNAVFIHIIARREEVAVFLVIGFSCKVIALPREITPGIPHDAKVIQKVDLLIGEMTDGLTVINLTLGIEPAAEGEAGLGFILIRDLEIAVGEVILFCFGVHEIPGGIKGTFQRIEEAAAVAGFINDFKAVIDDEGVITEVMVIGDGGLHLLLNRAYAIKILNI